MREIKFRAWDTKSCSWCSIFVMDMVGNLYFSTSSQGDGDLSLVGPIHKDIIILQLSTGLKDKIGKEIYDGDILSINCDIGSESVCFVDFRLGSFCLVDANRESNPLQDYFLDDWGSEVSQNYRLEVVGNIFDNPELMPK